MFYFLKYIKVPRVLLYTGMLFPGEGFNNLVFILNYMWIVFLQIFQNIKCCIGEIVI